jgi:soluble lytic murein transglycosylase-like protein
MIMDDNHRREKRVFVLIFCVYLVIAGAWIFGRPRRISPPLNEAPTAKSKTAAPTQALVLNNFLKLPKETGPPVAAELEQPAVQRKKAGDKFHPIIVDAANRYEVDPAMIKAIIWAESDFDPNAVSEQGAVGLMQLMPSTARSMGIKNCLNPEDNIHAGVRYFKQLMTQFDDNARLALAAYNAGSGKVREHQGIPPIKSTRYFVNKVFRYYRAIKEDLPFRLDAL